VIRVWHFGHIRRDLHPTDLLLLILIISSSPEDAPGRASEARGEDERDQDQQEELARWFHGGTSGELVLEHLGL
jgi:hypothetical protein